MIIPTNRLAALVIGSASAPISCISLGNERQSTEPGKAAVFRQRDSQRPLKSSASFAFLGSSGCKTTKPRQPTHRMCLRCCAVRPTLAIKCDQARRFEVVASTTRVWPPSASNRLRSRASRTAPAPSIRSSCAQVDIDRNAAIQTRLGFLHCPRHGRHMGQVESTCRYETCVVSFAVDSDGDE